MENKKKEEHPPLGLRLRRVWRRFKKKGRE